MPGTSRQRCAASTSKANADIEAGEESRRRERWWLAPLAIAAIALTARLLAIGVDAGYEPRNDAFDYHRHAVSIAAGDGYPDSEYGSGVGPTALRPPAYPVALAAVYAVSGDSVTAGRVLGAVLGAITAALVFFIAAPLWGRTVAIVAGSIVAIFPPLIRLSTELFSENLFIPLMLAALLCAMRYRASAQLRWAAATGVACGLALLTRNVGLALVVPLILAVSFGVGRTGWGRLAAPTVLLGCVAVALVPWTLRNIAEFDRVIPIAASSGVTLAGTYNDEADGDEAHPAGWRNPSTVAEFAPIFATPQIDEATLDAELRDGALDHISEHPGYVLEAAWHNLQRLFLLEGGSVVAAGREVTISGIGNTSALDEQVALAIVVALALLGLLAAAAARPLQRRSAVVVRRVPWFVWLLPALILLSSLPLGGLPRYRLAIDPFLAMFAALGLVAIREQVPALLGHGRRRALATAGVAALLGVGVFGGCGGEDEPEQDAPVTATTPAQKPAAASDRQFVADAERICADAIAETKALRRRILAEGLDPGLPPAEAIGRAIVEPGLEIHARQGAELRAIAPPEGQSAVLDTYIGLFDVIDELLRRRIDLGLEGATADAQNLELLIAEVGTEQRAAAKSYGFDACATDFLAVLLPPDAPG